MATRFYLHGPTDLFGQSITPTITPAFDGEWDRTTNASRRRCSPFKNISVLAEVTDPEGTATSPYDVLLRQFISDPLAAQTISGTVKGQIKCRESSDANDMSRALCIRVCSNDGTTIRGTLLNDFPESLTSEFKYGGTENRNFPPSTALSSVSASDGDRLLIELGYRSFNVLSGALRYGYLTTGDDAASDLPEDETATDDYSPWIEFSATLTFQYNRIEIYQVMAEIMYTASATNPIPVLIHDYRRRRM